MNALQGYPMNAKADSKRFTPARRMNADLVREIFNTLNRDTLALVDDLYAEGVQFTDPFHDIRGREALRDYYRKMYANVESVQFAFEGETSTPEELVLYWTMTYRHARLNSGRPVSLPGCSRLLFVVDPSSRDAGKVRLHRDYFDAGALLYEQVPLLGRVVRFIRERV